MGLVELLGWSLAGAATFTCAPQLLRLWRTGEIDGVSLATSRMAAATMVCWSWYSVDVGDVPALASSLGPLVVWVLVAVYIGRTPRELGWTAVVVAGAFVPAVVGFAHVGAVTGSMLWALPQLRQVLRFPAAPGVSVAAYALLGVENAAWVVYALATTHYAFMAAPLVQGPASLLIVVRVLRARRAAADPVAAPTGC